MGIKFFSRIIKFLVTVIFIIFIFSITISMYVDDSNSKHLYNSVEKIPYNKVGLLLGTSKYYKGGKLLNLFYLHRINATVELYNAGKIKYILVSGDNGTKNYDETTAMKDDLIKKGIPEKNIYLDYAGFRTLDSIIRAKEIFGQEKFTIISQHFHNARAVFIARNKGLEAIGYNAKDVILKKSARVKFREIFARGKMSLDLFFGIGPKFLGKKINIK